LIDTHDPVRPNLSVVICTYNRAPLLARLLDSLCRQTLPAHYFEVVVINDGSVDDTETVVAAYASRLPLQYGYQGNGGPASARNRGLFLCRGDILLFLDDDNIPAETLLEEHLKTHRQFPARHYAVLGYMPLSPEISENPLMHYVTEIGQFLLSYPSLKHGDILDYRYFWGGSSSCKRSLLLEFGIFNPAFRFGCEDVELGYRLSRRGLRIVFNGNAISYVSMKMDFDAFCHRSERQGASSYIFSRLHPEPEIQHYTEMMDSEQNRAMIDGHHEAIIKSARSLDIMANLKLAAGFDLTDEDRYLLYRAYYAAFKACKVKGIMNEKTGMSNLVEQQLITAGC
jgi:glycosyltransferase involved in cell wall biosynthesis